ncbi:DUF6476 family protein [Jannaschia sp. M317]|uniref:DUF6476 family protein n=1 Tax=Jannaschia sp. M317 TaxID=2867011 RepID=UPI0021A29652|nr:DUF6476 family protein [Jannaschia sp. M317]UWQ17860.1 hypothetical protein K3551_00635 [Jannaschia sp. M317]
MVSEDMDEVPEPTNLRFLRILVTVLTAVMIVGLLTVVTLLVTRLRAPAPVAAEALALPDGIQVHAVTQTPTRWLVTTTDDRLLIFAPDGTLQREVPLTP